MKKIIIFESMKGAGKTILINALKDRLKHCAVLGEDVTLDPIRHTDDHLAHVRHYKHVIKSIQDSSCDYFLLDRFHYIKWNRGKYDKNYFREVESALCGTGDAMLIFLKIDEDAILPRLEKTWKHRRASGWKYNGDGAPIATEAKRDAAYQRFFLEHQYVDTMLQKHIVDATALSENPDVLDAYAKEIYSLIQ